MQTPIQTSELSAVNVILSLMGESPVSTLTPPYGSDVATARNLLAEANKDILSEGWKFNKDEQYELTPDVDGHIAVPSNAISIDADTDSTRDIVVRSGYLYETSARTDVFTSSIKCEILWYFAFDELPEYARRYVQIVAARRYQARYLGSENQHMYSELDETKARILMMRGETDTADYNMLKHPDQAYIARKNGPPRRFR